MTLEPHVQKDLAAGSQAAHRSPPPLPGEKVPDLRMKRLPDSEWNLHETGAGRSALLVFYRGLHCPLCREQLETLNAMLDEFKKREVAVFAASCDGPERAEKTRQEWDIDAVTLLYGLSIEQARDWGLYVSQSISDNEPDRFCEPGMFLLTGSGTVYGAWIQSVPFARPHLEDILGTVDFVREKDYPPRGTVAEAA